MAEILVLAILRREALRIAELRSIPHILRYFYETVQAQYEDTHLTSSFCAGGMLYKWTSRQRKGPNLCLGKRASLRTAPDVFDASALSLRYARTFISNKSYLLSQLYLL